MRTVLTAIFGLALAACAGETAADNDAPPPGERPYPSERGVIVYQMTGQMSGDETITWDNWGMRSVTVTNMTLTRADGERATSATRTIITPDVTYAYSSQAAGYVRMNMGSRRMFSGEVRDVAMLVEAGTDMIAGVECQRHVHSRAELGMEVCMAGHLPLHVVTPPFGAKTATSINLNARVDASIFEPDGNMVLEMAAPREPQP